MVTAAQAYWLNRKRRQKRNAAEGVGVSFLPETEALVARFTTPPTPERKVLINTLIQSLKDASVWPDLDALVVWAAADSQAARRNWVQDLYNSTVINSPTFTPDRGYSTDGATSFGKTGFIPSTAVSPNFVQNAASLGFYSRLTRAAGNVTDMGASNTSTVRIAIKGRYSPGIQVAANSNGFANSGSDLGTIGHFAVSRTSAMDVSAFFDGASVGTLSQASVGVEDVELYVGCQNFGNNLNAGVANQYSYYFIGALTAAQIADLTAAMDTYLLAVGAK